MINFAQGEFVVYGGLATVSVTVAKLPTAVAIPFSLAASIVMGGALQALTSLASQTGVTILIAEQNAALGLNIAHRGYVLQKGQLALKGTASELQSNKELIRFYLGGESQIAN